MAASKAVPFGDGSVQSLNLKTCFRGPLAPVLALSDDLGAKYRIYLLRCAPQIVGGPWCWYVGVVPKEKVEQRILEQFSGQGADYTAVNRPVAVELVQPATGRSAEAYLFYAMVEKLPIAAVTDGRLGGWTQTRPRPSQLSKLMLEDAKRMVNSKCMACGASDHLIKDKKKCPKADSPDSVPITCGQCQATLRVTALGAIKTIASLPAAEGKRPRSADADAAPQPKAPRRAEPAAPALAASTQAPAAAAQRHFPEVLVLGHKYTTLEWFLGRGAYPKERAKVLRECGEHAVELSGGNHNTLLTSNFARTLPRRCKELFPGRTNWPCIFKKTACKAARPPCGAVQAKLVRQPQGLRNILLRVSDLKECFQS